MNLSAFRTISYGVFIISAKSGDKLNGQIANVAVQVSNNPCTIAICINKQNLTHKMIEESKVFSISVLSQNSTLAYIGKFGFKSGKDTDKFKDTKYKTGTTGVPIVLDYAVSYFELELINSMDANTHTVFLGKVVECDTLNSEPPLTYDYYHNVIKGKSPKTAPTYIPEIKETIKKEDAKMSKYECIVCGYVYDPAVGDPDSGIKPGTPFEQIPDTWVCPTCGADKTQFKKID